MAYSIKKASGKKEQFDVSKLQRSLHAISKDKKLIDAMVKKVIAAQPKTTRAIHNMVIETLEKKDPATAARYNLKRALMELGPAGYSFEQFVAHLFEQQKYHVVTNQIVRGKCIEHEVDIIAKKDHKHYMIECKFHNRSGPKSDVKVALYIQARFEDINIAWEQSPTDTDKIHQAWIISNTQFTSVAQQYASCVGIKLLGWKYPKQKGLAHLIDQFGIHPITSLTRLSKAEKRYLAKNGLVLCKDAHKYPELFKQLGFSPQKIKRTIAQAHAVCQNI